TFMRRVKEELKLERLIEVGTRAVCREELDYAEEAGIEMVTADRIRLEATKTVSCLKKKLSQCENVYLTIDMDVLDPAHAPAVQNPEPGGLSTHELLNILRETCDSRIVGFDVVEVAPNFDNGVSAIHAAKIILETLCFLEKSRLDSSSTT
ncbi:MAG: arginase family protein, partial [Candidatus Hodarchaeota archaeon]